MPRKFAACFPILMLIAACATAPVRDVFILLPDDQGKTGAIVVLNAQGETLLSKPRETLTIDAAGRPGKPFQMSDKDVDARVGAARYALPEPPVRIIFYFKYDSDELTEESRAKLPEVLRSIRERGPVDISVVGHTDTMGEKDYNYKLSFRRAQAVAKLLTAQGVAAAVLEITSHGKDNPLVPTGNQVPEPRNRRVEVTVR